MPLKDMKSVFGKIIKPKFDEDFGFVNYNPVPLSGRIPSKKPISNIVMSGGYIPGNNYGDDPGIDEV